MHGQNGGQSNTGLPVAKAGCHIVECVLHGVVIEGFSVDIRSRWCTHVGPVLGQFKILAGVVREDHVVCGDGFPIAPECILGHRDGHRPDIAFLHCLRDLQRQAGHEVEALVRQRE